MKNTAGPDMCTPQPQEGSEKPAYSIKSMTIEAFQKGGGRGQMPQAEMSEGGQKSSRVGVGVARQ